MNIGNAFVDFFMNLTHLGRKEKQYKNNRASIIEGGVEEEWQ